MALREMIEENIGALEVRGDVHDAYNEAVDGPHLKMVWSHPGMSNWYRNAKGRVTANSPWRLVDYWRLTRERRAGDFIRDAGGGR